MKKVFDFYADTNKKNKEAFFDALPIGNGHLGAMIYGNPFEEKLVLNENTFWLGNKDRVRYPKDFYKNYKEVQRLLLEEKYSEAEHLTQIGLFPNPKGEAIYTVGAEMRLSFPKEKIDKYERTLHLDEGFVSVKYESKENRIVRRYYASYPDDVIVVELEALKEIELVCSLDRDKLVDRIEATANQINLECKFNQSDEFHICVRGYADEVKSLGASLILKGKHIKLHIAMATSLYNPNPKKYVNQCLEQCLKQDIFENAKKDYMSLYHKQSFICDDEDMTYMYNFSRYLMISSSRKNLPANLQGLWNQDIFPSWDSKYTININLQMNYWNVFSSNLVPCFEPYLKLLETMYPRGKELAKELYHVDGFVAHHNTDIYGDCGLQDHYLPATTWMLGAAWLSQTIFDAYIYTQDIVLLKRYGYLLEDAAMFLLNICIKDKRNYLVLCPSLSPENSFYHQGSKHHLSLGCVMDDEIIYDVFTKTIQMNQILHQHEDINQSLKEALSCLYPFTKSQYGTLREWHEDYEEAEPGHRHISHLYGLYPSNQIHPGTEEFDLAKRTLKRRLEYGGGHTGWSMAWICAMYTRLKDGENSYSCFKSFMKKSTSRVGLDLHPPFQIDGNFGIAAAIKEMFVYDEEGYIEIFPAKPKEILSVKFFNILLKGNLLLSLEYQNGKLKYTIEATRSVNI
ncbi:MAG: glycoside hydrolase family 95 protein, partial [Anaeroplasmataceae bacterium]|nr:glycoside hydrolase family 95 protein [Anaeroplasmataceae bacterium]